MTTDSDVQADVVPDGTPSPEVGTPPEGEPQPQVQPLTEEMKAEIVKAVAEQVESGKRELQSVKDKARREVEDAQARATFAEQGLAGMETEFTNVDPEAAEKAKRETALRGYQQREAMETQRRQAVQVVEAFESDMQQYITESGIDPNDKRIDWGNREKEGLNLRNKKILASVGKIQKENVKAEKDNVKKEFDDWKRQAEIDLGIHSHEPSASPGAGDNDAEFLDKFGKGEVPYTKANEERARKIMNK